MCEQPEEISNDNLRAILIEMMTAAPAEDLAKIWEVLLPGEIATITTDWDQINHVGIRPGALINWRVQYALNRLFKKAAEGK